MLGSDSSLFDVLGSDWNPWNQVTRNTMESILKGSNLRFGLFSVPSP